MKNVLNQDSGWWTKSTEKKNTIKMLKVTTSHNILVLFFSMDFEYFISLVTKERKNESILFVGIFFCYFEDVSFVPNFALFTIVNVLKRIYLKCFGSDKELRRAKTWNVQEECQQDIQKSTSKYENYLWLYCYWALLTEQQVQVKCKTNKTCRVFTLQMEC